MLLFRIYLGNSFMKYHVDWEEYMSTIINKKILSIYLSMLKKNYYIYIGEMDDGVILEKNNRIKTIG